MIHLPDLIRDLGILLLTGAVVSLLFRSLKQPVVLGYLVAGFLLSPHSPISALESLRIRELDSVKVWAELGVIFLLFCLGLEFSFRKLATVGRSAATTAFVEVFFMLGLGFAVARGLGWSQMDAWFLGGILAISSTTIIVKAFEEMGLKGRRFVSLVYGALVVEDILAILLLVALASFGASLTLEGTGLLFVVAKLGFFLVLWFLLGIYFLPPFLAGIRKLLNEESTLLVALGLCLLMAMIATQVGFSPALGAFVMGSLLAETRERARIEHLMQPVRNLFAAVFFISVGMLLDSRILGDYWWEILLLSLITVVGKTLSTVAGALLSGVGIRQSIQAGLSMAQIGEFSFLIATLGLTLGVISEFLYPIAVAVSAITTFTTPYMIRHADGIAKRVEDSLSPNVRASLLRYQAGFAEESQTGQSVVALFLSAFGTKVLFNATLILATMGFSSSLVLPWLEKTFFHSQQTPYTLEFTYAVCALAAISALPFLWAFVHSPARAAMSSLSQERMEPLKAGFQIIRWLLAIALSLAVFEFVFPLPGKVPIIASALWILTLVLWRSASGYAYAKMEGRFHRNLESRKQSVAINPDSSTDDSVAASQEKLRSETHRALSPWDVGMADFVVHPNSVVAGKNLMEAKIKEKFGATVAMIERGEARILAPDRNCQLMPMDRLYIIGTDEQLVAAQGEIESASEGTLVRSNWEDSAFGLRAVRLGLNSAYVGKPLRDSGLREAVGGLVVGIERNSQRILSPSSDLHLEPQDTLWVVGDLLKIQSLAEGSAEANPIIPPNH